MAVLKELILAVFTLRVCGGLDFGEDVAVLKELILTISILGRMWQS